VAKRSLDEPQALTLELAQAAYELHVRLERQLQGPLQELGLTLPLADALWQLDPARGPVSRRELAERLHCDPSNVTFLVDRLQERKLVARGRARGDRRVRALMLTPSGAEVRTRLITTVARSQLFTQLTPPQRRQLATLLARCVSRG
jgi:MarR family transcriptional regulator, organic hydroperoxide resistance regulator